ncbi:HlyD family secretion protein [Tranquillimonas alkanivorans]|uniref:HlyD family secretion protein n=2 Tax=Tranquillimonas alkanivorans TaxID=441119 RepID=A0A1I5V5I3_9RHOB|nr:HlyD family secretion protein [Tranquillimonas alkanivorans]
MLSRHKGWALFALVLIGIAVAAAVLLRPRPVLVDLGRAETGSLAVTVEEEAHTRIRNLFTVSAPVSGRVLRTPVRVGDTVAEGETVLATILPTPSGLVDERTRSELLAALTAADAATDLARHEIGGREAEVRFAESELERKQSLSGRNVLSREALEEAETRVRTAQHALEAAQAELEVRRSRRTEIAARLEEPSGSEQPDRKVHVKAPVSGEVLRILQESESIVPAGAPLVEVGDLGDLEVVADLLSTDAVQVEVGAPARIVDWGGAPLDARVAEVEPIAFPKISALGIEELRARVVLDIKAAPGTWQRLGHGYRVTAQILLWEADSVLKVPVASLFREGEDWAVFVVQAGRAAVRKVAIGRMNEDEAQVLEGLEPGDRVVLYPSDRVTDGARLAERAGG